MVVGGGDCLGQVSRRTVMVGSWISMNRERTKTQIRFVL